MNEPWGISGPQFIGLYVVLLCLPALVGTVSAWAVRRNLFAARYDGRPVTVYELAYLIGGEARVVETVVSALVERGQLRVSSSRKLKAAGPLPTEPLEHAVANAANDAVGSTTRGIKNWVLRSQPMRTLVAGLERRGLVVSYTKLRQSRRLVAWLYVAVLAVGVVRLVNGLVLERPVGVLIGLVAVAFVVLLVASRRNKRELAQPPSAAGQQLVAGARAQKNTGAQLGTVLAGAAGAVALGGLVKYPDKELSSVLLTQPSTAFGGMTGGGGSSSSGSSCSGGSSCGGGGGSSCGGGGCGG